MKTLLICLLIVIMLPVSLLAQGPGKVVVLTKPGSYTNLVIKFDPRKKIPQLDLPCLLTNGKNRPYECEFSFYKLEFYGNDGSLLGTVKRTKGQPLPTPLPFNKAKNSAPAGQTGQITYTVKAYFTRRAKPAFPVAKGYQIRSCMVTNCLQSDNISMVLAEVKMPDGLHDQATLTFDLSWLYGKKSGQMIGPHELYIENDVTTTKFAFTVQNTMRDKSEAWLDIKPIITGDPSPAN